MGSAASRLPCAQSRYWLTRRAVHMAHSGSKKRSRAQLHGRTESCQVCLRRAVSGGDCLVEHPASSGIESAISSNRPIAVYSRMVLSRTMDAGRSVARLHHLRGTFATHLMTHPTAPLTDQEIGDLMGWSNEQVSDIRKRYVDDAASVVALGRHLGGKPTGKRRA